MTVVSSKRASRSYSDNRKSKIQNLKCVVGLFSLIIAFVGLAGAVEAQQAGKIFRIGFLDSSNASSMAALSDALAA